MRGGGSGWGSWEGGRKDRGVRRRGGGVEGRACSVQATPSEVVGDDDVGDGVEHHLDISCVCGAGHVTVDFFIWGAVLALKLCLDVSRCVLVGIGSCREKQRNWRVTGSISWWESAERAPRTEINKI